MKKIIIVDDSESYRSRIKRDSLKPITLKLLKQSMGKMGSKFEIKNLDADAILDMNMPGMDAISRMISILRQEDDFHKIPVLIVTTESSSKQKNHAKELGVIAWIQKPISGKALVKTLASL